MMVVADRGRKRGWGGAVMVQGNTYRHVALGAETSVRGWRVAGVVNVQVERSFLWESGWGASA